MQGRARLAGIGVALAVVLSAAPAAFAAPVVTTEAFSLKVLSPADARAYSSAFALTREARFADAAHAAEGLSDPRLQGRLAFARLMHPDYHSTFEELTGWLKAYRDQPEAGRIYSLALKRQLKGA